VLIFGDNRMGIGQFLDFVIVGYYGPSRFCGVLLNSYVFHCSRISVGCGF
jgi:hypothetical protein